MDRMLLISFTAAFARMLRLILSALSWISVEQGSNSLVTGIPEPANNLN